MISFLRRRRTLEGSLGWMGMETQTMVKRLPNFFFIKKSIIDNILAIRLEGLFWARNKVGCSFGFGLWAWPLEASHYARPKAPLTLSYWLLFSAHFFDLSTKFGHSIPRPLDLDGHSVKWPWVWKLVNVMLNFFTLWNCVTERSRKHLSISALSSENTNHSNIDHPSIFTEIANPIHIGSSYSLTTM
jgi:hypothetical protein